MERIYWTENSIIDDKDVDIDDFDDFFEQKNLKLNVQRWPLYQGAFTNPDPYLVKNRMTRIFEVLQHMHKGLQLFITCGFNVFLYKAVWFQFWPNSVQTAAHLLALVLAMKLQQKNISHFET